MWTLHKACISKSLTALLSSDYKWVFGETEKGFPTDPGHFTASLTGKCWQNVQKLLPIYQCAKENWLSELWQ